MTRKDTRKAERAKAFGTQVIDQVEMMAFVKKGKFAIARAWNRWIFQSQRVNYGM